MSRVPSSGNRTTEERLVRLLRSSHVNGWLRHQQLPGRPDFVWRREKVAVFVDGCYWHGHDCRNLVPKTNAMAWQEKLTETRGRDKRNNLALRKMGWTVIRIWECDLAKHPDRCVQVIRQGIERMAVRRPRIKVADLPRRPGVVINGNDLDRFSPAEWHAGA